MIYLIVIIVAAVAGITRLAMQQRREQKKHLLDDFRASLERLARQPLPAQGSAPTANTRMSRRSRKKRYQSSPRGEWDRVALGIEPGFLVGDRSSSEDKEQITFAPEVQGHEIVAPVTEEPELDEPVSSPRVRKERQPRKSRKPLLAGRLWRAPREPWLWTYSKPRRPAQRSRRAVSDVAYVDFEADDVLYATEGNLAHSSRPPGSRSPHSAPHFVGPHDSVRRGTAAGREAVRRRHEAERRSGSRLS